MKTPGSTFLRFSPGITQSSLLAVITSFTLLLSASVGHAERGTKYTTSRGGSAYVGPNGVAARGANGNSAVKTDNGTTATARKNANGSTTYNTSNGGKAYVGPNGAAAKGPNGNTGAVVNNGNGNNYQGSGTYVKTTTVRYNSSYPQGYYTSVPPGYQRVYYGGYQCYYVGGVYYRSVVSQGTTVFIVVK
ncbi:MAG: hypothetical protein ACAI35_18640 [Candidatus Methylacidiphilales bacterium]|nr:hypothetical protein [Candidatus Methylacidiphilales bacterium]